MGSAPAPGGTTAGLLLAAGASRRLGTPKQLVTFEGEALVRRAARALLAACDGGVLCVLGHAHRAVAAALADLPVTSIHADGWERGMGASLAAGAARLPRDVDAVLVAACDQARLDAGHYARLLAAARADGCAAARYGGVTGIPAVFPARLFPALRALDGERGARALLAAEAALMRVDLPEAAFDLDHPGDLAVLGVEP